MTHNSLKQAGAPATNMVDLDPRTDEVLRLLRWYPKRWRAANSLVVAGMLLDRADRSGGQLTKADKVSLILGGLRERLLPFEPPSVRSIVAVSVAAAFSIYYAAFVIWSPGVTQEGALGPFSNPSALTAALLVAASAASMTNRAKTSRTLARSALLIDLVIGLCAHTYHWLGPSPETALVFAGLAATASIRMRHASASRRSFGSGAA